MTKQEDLFGGDPSAILDKLNKTLDELVRYKNVLIATIDTANNRMEKIESRLDKVKPEGTPKEMTVQIEKIEETIERVSGEVKNLDKKLTNSTVDKAFVIEKLENSEKNIEEISKITKELTQKFDEDNKYMQGLDIELKSHIEDTDEKIKESGREVAKISKEIESANKMKKAFKELIAAISE